MPSPDHSWGTDETRALDLCWVEARGTCVQRERGSRGLVGGGAGGQGSLGREGTVGSRVLGAQGEPEGLALSPPGAVAGCVQTS